MEDLIRVENIKKLFPVKMAFSDFLQRKKKSYLHAVDGVSFTIRKGEIFCLAGESGCGKTTTGRLMLRMEEPTSGRVVFDGEDITTLNKKSLKTFRRKAQIIFQNPYDSLDPRIAVFDQISEGLLIHKIGKDRAERIDLVTKTMEEVGLVPVKDIMSRYPHELSGGQRQRVSIASSIILRPKFIVADEPVSMLDMSIRASVLNLLLNLRKTMNLAFLFITHDLALAKYFADRMAIMYLGRIVEMGKVEDVIDNPCHPYSRALISAVPSPNPDEKMDELKIKGDISSSMFLRQGCRFEPRCPFSSEACLKEEPELTEIKKGHFVACTKPLM